MLKGDTNIHWGKARKFWCGIGVGPSYVFRTFLYTVGVSQVALVVKNPPANTGVKRQGLDPWVTKIP